uniref:MalT-like TPR region domain-containing protein n=1 Tax=Glossina pallidipes TaxID=7398 RepID=A0A1A9Z5T5_GLOPL
MPKKEKYHFDVTYDRKELKKHISAIAYREARRVTGPIYDVLITELLEDGLTYTAKHFQTEINTEDEYFRENVIRDRLMDQPTLLFDIYDKCRMAEKMALLPNYEGLHQTFNLLHQVILKLQTPQNLNSINFENWEYVSLGKHKTSIKYYDMAMKLAVDRNWLAEVRYLKKEGYSKLTQELARMKAKSLLELSKLTMSSDMDRALSFHRKALLILSEGGLTANQADIISTLLTSAEIYVEEKHYRLANKILEDVENELKFLAPNKYDPMMSLRLALSKAISLLNLSDEKESMQYFLKALVLSRQLGRKEHEAKAMLNLGKLQELSNQKSWAKASFKKAIQFYSAVGDIQNYRRSTYVLADTMCHSLFPLILDLIKGSRQFCHRYMLRRWKNQMQPFWFCGTMAKLYDSRDDINCLVHEDIASEVGTALSERIRKFEFVIIGANNLKRHVMTAEIAGESLGLKFTPDIKNIRYEEIRDIFNIH